MTARYAFVFSLGTNIFYFRYEDDLLGSTETKSIMQGILSSDGRACLKIHFCYFNGMTSARPTLRDVCTKFNQRSSLRFLNLAEHLCF